MRKRRSWGRKEPHWAPRPSSNSSTSAQGHQGAFRVVVGRNHLEEGIVSRRGIDLVLN